LSERYVKKPDAHGKQFPSDREQFDKTLHWRSLEWLLTHTNLENLVALLAEESVPNVFMRTAGEVSTRCSGLGVYLSIIYDTAVTAASGQIWDIGGNASQGPEQWRVEALSGALGGGKAEHQIVRSPTNSCTAVSSSVLKSVHRL
jgi:hypothetical protein